MAEKLRLYILKISFCVPIKYLFIWFTAPYIMLAVVPSHCRYLLGKYIFLILYFQIHFRLLVKLYVNEKMKLDILNSYLGEVIVKSIFNNPQSGQIHETEMK